MQMHTNFPRFGTPATQLVRIAADGASLTGELTTPDNAAGLVVFSHTNASGRASRDDRRVANDLREKGFATLVFNLLTPDEELIDGATHGLGSDLPLLARRLIDTIGWIATQPAVNALDIGLLGHEAGGAAALVAACVKSDRVATVVSYARHPDLASPVLGRIYAPVLLICDGNDDAAVRANRSAFHRLRCAKELVMIDASAHAREGRDDLSDLAVGWFTRHLNLDRTVGAAIRDEFA